MDADLLPPAGDGWRSRAAVRDGNAVPLGKPLARGCTGIHSVSLSAAAHASAKDQAARSEAERAEREADQMRFCNPTKSAVLARVGSRNLAEDFSVPEGQAKSEQVPVRRPPSARRATAPERVLALFLFHRAMRVLFLALPKREWGAHPPWKRPPAGAGSPRPARGEKKRRPALRPAASRSAFTPKIP